MSSALAAAEAFTPEEASALAPYFGNTDLPVFVLTSLPEAVKGALFARYSRSAKSARRLFLDEFLGEGQRPGVGAPATGGANEAGGVQGMLPLPPSETGPGQGRAHRLYSRILAEYGDDSVAQLGGAHLACEGISNVATKIVERGRLMAYLEQSTRYVPLTARPGGNWPYVVPAEIDDPALRARFVETLDRAFATYARWIEPLQAYYRRRHPRAAGDSEGVHRSVIRAKALDALRGLLPAATRSNVGIYGSGQAYEALLLRMQAHELAESRELAGLMLAELRKVIPAFLERVDREDRGGRWRDYLRRRNADSRSLAAALATKMAEDCGADASVPADGVVLTDFDPEGEVKVVAAALYPASGLTYDRLLAAARAMTVEERIRVLRASVGERENRRHRPGRAFEHATYGFDVLTDYGAFRDLQRHRMLTIDWQDLTVRHGSVRPGDVDAVGARADWDRAMADSADLHERASRACSPLVAQYAVSMAYCTRFHLRMNAREAMHVLELRTTPQGHPAYRRVCQRMHRLIAEGAGHAAIADAMTFVDHGEVALERLDAERRSERRRATSGGGAGHPPVGRESGE